MICNSICNVINQLGTECILSEYNSNGACIVKGILQPIKNNARENGGVDHTNAGVVDNSGYNLLFNLPDRDINLENATVYAYDKYFWIKEFKIFYLKNKRLYAQAKLSPYTKE
ncbi:MAG: hypothetical protein UHY68_08660 [Acutalibacteraceae bacterium]|nr:hypothetical protein [Acutalibacteraceae bacterium]